MKKCFIIEYTEVAQKNRCPGKSSHPSLLTSGNIYKFKVLGTLSKT